ncbi:MAG: MCE family protein [Planctomycetes bacterium]|nr:MCE family protein [Planctomycetota bacterium]
MAISHRVERIVGIFILLPFLTFGALVLVSGTRKGWFENKLELEATFDQGLALRPGASVVMEGVRIGWVDSVEFDPENRVEVHIKIRKRFASQVRTDSVAVITKLNLLGEPVVVISKGAADQPRVDDGVEIQTRATRDVKPQELRQLLLDTIDLVSQLNSKRTTIGKVIRDDGRLYNDLTTLLASGNRLLKDAPPVPVELTEKSILTMHLDARLQKQVDGLVAMADRLDKMLAKANGGEGTLGKFLNDPNVFNEITALVKETRELVAEFKVTAKYLKEIAPALPDLVESGDALIRRADGLLQKIDANPLLGGPPVERPEKPPAQIEERFKHYRPQKSTPETDKKK